ncbi:MAG: ApaG domain-containing protein [Monoraphidium minutum]|nr:MAG: ApaG domain-containing protein [Monoraphidium minutum]
MVAHGSRLFEGAAEPAAAAAPGRGELQQALERAVAAEDYVEAARLKAALDAALLQDPLVVLQRQLQAAVDEERYQDAARLRDQLRELQEKLQPPKPEAASTPPTSSDEVTAGVRVKVQSMYVPSQSVPTNRQFFFAYRVTISNEGTAVVMLKSRHWVITDGEGHIDHVRGPGVVGEQPVLHPGSSFQYESACPLRTPSGKMEGSYQMVVMDAATGEWGEALEVKIGAFGLNKDA